MNPTSTGGNDALAMTAAMTQAVAETQVRQAEKTRAAAQAQMDQAAAAERMRASYGRYAQDVDRAARRNREMVASIKDGSFTRHYREMERLNREYAKLARQAELVARHGRAMGGFLARNEGGLRVAGGVAMAGYAAGAGMVARGFSGTVEMNRLQLEFKLASRELAGAFVPAINAATRLMRRFSDRLARMGPEQQNRLMVGGLAVGGALAAHGLLRATAGVGLATAAGGAASWLTGGFGAGVAGGAAAGLGTRAIRGAGALAKRIPGIALGAGAAMEAFDDDGYYEMLRRRGTSKLGSFFGAAGGVGLDVLTFGAFGRRMREKGELGAGAKGPDPTRDRVTYPGGGFDEPGSFYDRFAAEYGQVAASPEEVAATAAIVGVLTDILGVLREGKLTPDASLDRPAGGG